MNNCGEYAYDVMATVGQTLSLPAGWEDGIYGYENSKGVPRLWTKHQIADSSQTEGLILTSRDAPSSLHQGPSNKLLSAEQAGIPPSHVFPLIPYA